ncbi:hypothetical protein [Paenibacillus campi]|uniref:hypothetical protein n=1 Tax=Paenibacillus campi TaxID=3106031 RepID=UPI002AFE6830|nr:hypothetical protein [Paenibacillus sp. SGZ-1014]
MNFRTEASHSGGIGYPGIPFLHRPLPGTSFPLHGVVGRHHHFEYRRSSITNGHCALQHSDYNKKGCREKPRQKYENTVPDLSTGAFF